MTFSWDLVVKSEKDETVDNGKVNKKFYRESDIETDVVQTDEVHQFAKNTKSS